MSTKKLQILSYIGLLSYNAQNLTEEEKTQARINIGVDPAGTAEQALSNANTYTDITVANLVDSAPETLNTLNELAIAIQENDDVTSALDAAITNKAETSDLTSHISNTSNPHNVTISQIGASIEAWTFVLADGSTVTKNVVVGQ